MYKSTLLLITQVLLAVAALAQTQDGTVDCPFGALPYRLFFPQNATDTTCVIHVSRGGNGLGDDRSQLMPYVNHLIQNGYAVVQLDHRFAGNDIENIARLRGEEIGCIAQKVSENALNWGAFQGTIDSENQGFAGHSGGCMEGLEAAGTGMSHGNYYVPQIKAVYGMSPAGFIPDQFGIQAPPSGYAAINNTAIFLVIGEQENNVNGAGMFMANAWRQQAFEAMNENSPRYQAFFQGNNTAHNDISLNNPDIVAFNQANALAFFDVYLKNKNRKNEIGTLQLPPANPLILNKKGIAVNVAAPASDSPALTVFPNPAGDYCYIDPSCEDPMLITLSDTDGRQVLRIQTDKRRLDLSALHAGLYLLEITCGGKRFQRSLLKY